MSSPDSEILTSTSLPISELIKHINDSFRERDFNKVQNILMDRENDTKMEIAYLIRDRDAVKEEARLLERNGNLAELERLKLEENLQKTRRKCEELEETVTRLLEEKRVSNDREKRAEERCDKIAAENLKMTNEKNKSIFELNEKINELKNKNLENERLMGIYQEKCKGLDIKIVKMGQEIEELRLKQLEGDQVVDELKHGNLEANKTIDELRLKKSESELYMSRFENLSPRIKNIEEELAAMFTVNVGDIADLVNDVRKLSTSEERRNLEFPYSKGKNDSSGNGSTPDDAEDVVVLSPGVPSTPISTGSRSKGLSKKGAHGSGTRLMYGAGRFSKTTRSSSAAVDIIQIIDSDDEANPDGASDMSNRGVSSKVGENEMNFVLSPLSSQRSKRKRTDSMWDLFAINMCTGNEDNVLIQEKENEVVQSTHDRIDCSSSRRCGEEAGPASDSQIPLEKLNGLNDEISGDSEDEESLSDSRIHDFIASLRSEKLGRKFMYEADMLLAFQQDEQLCMNAVCALYRQQTKSKRRSNLSKNGGFSPVHSMSGCALAEYLIDCDKELRLRKSVSEVKKQRPHVIGQCRKLANIYVEKLFAIYCAGEDPFFGQT